MLEFFFGDDDHKFVATEVIFFRENVSGSKNKEITGVKRTWLLMV